MTWQPKFSLRTLVVFPLLLTCGIGLLLRWPAWSLDVQIRQQPFVVSASFSADGQEVAIRRGKIDGGAGRVVGAEETVRHVETGKEIRSRPLQKTSAPIDDGRLYISPDGTRTLEMLFDPERSIAPMHWNDRRRGRVVVRDATSYRWLGDLVTEDGDVVSARFSPDGEKIVTATKLGDIRIWRRRRPEWWWGVFYLWEFWLTVAFAGLFVWSVVRDRRRIGSKSEPTE